MSQRQQEQQGAVQAWEELKAEIIEAGELCGCINWGCWSKDERNENVCAECQHHIEPEEYTGDL